MMKLRLNNRRFMANMNVKEEMEKTLYYSWTFLGLTYNPQTDEAFCVVNDMWSKMETESKSGGPDRPLRFFGQYPFYIDDLVYAPVHFNQEYMMKLYNQSKSIIT